MYASGGAMVFDCTDPLGRPLDDLPTCASRQQIGSRQASSVPGHTTHSLAEHVVIPAIQRFALASSHAARDTSGSRRGGTRARGLTILLHAAATPHRRRCTFREHSGRPPPTAARDSFLLYATDLGQRVGWHGHHRTHTAVNAGVTKRWRERTVPSKVPPSVNYLA